MAEILTPDLCVVGAGAGGVAAACAAALAGAEVVIVEPRQFDDSYSNAALFAHVLIESARKATMLRSDPVSATLEIGAAADVAAVRMRAEKLAARLAHDTPARLAALNIKMIKAAGRFTSEKRLEAGTAIIEAKWFIIATGAVPPPQPAIKGIDLAPPLAPADLAGLETWPKRLILAGDDGQALALAQAFRRFGTEVHLLSRGDLLPGEDRELVAPIRDRLWSEGVSLHPHCAIMRLEPQGSSCMVEALEGGAPLRLEAPHLVMFAPPVARTEGLGLAEAGVDYDKDAIKVRDDLRTSNPRIYAIGDVVGSTRSYAKARYQAHQVIGQLFDSAARRPAPSPRLVFTEPELAIIGLTEAEAQAAGHDIRVLRAGFRDNVAAHLAGESEGHVKIITDAQDRLLGAGIVGGQARELIGIFGFALSLRLRAADLKGFIPASPSLTETSRSAVLASPLQFGKTLWRRIFPMPRRFK